MSHRAYGDRCDDSVLGVPLHRVLIDARRLFGSDPRGVGWLPHPVGLRVFAECRRAARLQTARIGYVGVDGRGLQASRGTSREIG
ncbi:hypothetical protein Ate01nite_61080 [Actinoplanes teichomyceticus]|nr:hypothetical protein Ate01nite_61080 [Actinoplanes teichomyceticus]